MKTYNFIFNMLLIAVISVEVVGAKNAPSVGGGNGGSPTPPSPSSIITPSPVCLRPTSREELNINNVRASYFNRGDMFWDGTNPKYEVPKVTDLSQPRRHSIFSAAIWVGGLQQGTTNQIVLAQTYSGTSQSTYFAGPIDYDLTGTATEPLTTQARCLLWNRHFKIGRTDVTDFLTRFNKAKDENLPFGEDDIPESVKRWPAKGNTYLGKQSSTAGINMDDYDLARFVDVDGDGLYNPVMGDFPELPGGVGNSGADQVIFWIMNDVGARKQFTPNSYSPAIGLEIHVEAFGYSTNDSRNNMTFLRQKLINKGGNTLEKTYLGQWVDPDLGNASDDYVECDVERGLGICYNGDDNDEGIQGYGQNPPSLAVDFFKGAIADPNDGVDNDKDCSIDESGELIIMSNFHYYIIGADSKRGDPDIAETYYGYLRSIWKDNTPVTYDYKSGISAVSPATPASNFIFPGSSDNRIGWSAGGSCTTEAAKKPANRTWTEVTAGNPPGDRRFLQSSGPFTLRPGAINEITVGIIWARANSGGATGSFNALLQADDAAQKLFDNDFKTLRGPNSPIMEITELDGELIISLTPDVYSTGTSTITTETYTERDPSLKTGNGDTLYRFQGYILYQLINDRVSNGELDDRNVAKIVMQCDVKDGVGRIINKEFDPDVEENVPKVKVNGEDKGIVSSVRVTQDLFATGSSKLINHKKYYYLVVAYAYNDNGKNDIKFLRGTGPGVSAATPHKTNPEQFGTVLNTSYGDLLPVTRVSGLGSGGSNLDITSESVDSIMSKGYARYLAYQSGKSPIAVKVYDPKRVKAGDFTIKLTGLLRYKPTLDTFRVGDVLRSRLTFPTNGPTFTINQFAGLARVVRVIKKQEGIIDLEVEPLNNGVFLRKDNVLKDDAIVGYADVKGIIERVDLDANMIPKTPTTNIKTGMSEQYNRFEYWQLRNNTTGSLTRSSRTISQSGEQLFPDYGISVSITGARNPGELPLLDPSVGFTGFSSLSFSSNARWLSGINDADRTLLVPDIQDPAVQPITDVAMIYKNVLGGAWAPYSYHLVNSLSPTAGGASVYSVGLRDNSTVLNSLSNVNVVLTNDKSLWTRVPVIQLDTVDNRIQVTKSRITSVDKEFQPETKISPFPFNGATVYASRGMSWFPGYAIDIDRGVRLNMMFSESAISDPVNGNNLKWEPTSSVATAGAKSFIYIGRTVYDEARDFERLLDSTYYRLALPTSPGIAKGRISAFFVNNINWVGAVRSTIPVVYPQTSFPSEATVKLRVKRAFSSYTPAAADSVKVPIYNFSTKGFETVRENIPTAKSALGAIRVVPNPYYAYSSYEGSQVDNRVRITNIPTKCTIQIFNLSGSLIRQFNVDYSGVKTLNNVTWQEWDLKNQVGISIASGAYLIHVDAGELGQTTLKWFGGLRPIDLDALGQ